MYAKVHSKFLYYLLNLQKPSALLNTECCDAVFTNWLASKSPPGNIISVN